MSRSREGGQYGAFGVVSEWQSGGLGRTVRWYVEDAEGERMQTNTGDLGKTQARTLAATLDAAGADSLDVLPSMGTHRRARPKSEERWERWASENVAVPLCVATAGKAPLAGWLKVVDRRNKSWIAERLDVSHATVEQYLSDLRNGRR